MIVRASTFRHRLARAANDNANGVAFAAWTLVLLAMWIAAVCAWRLS